MAGQPISYSLMPVCAAVKIRSIPLCWFGSWQTMVSSCPPTAVLDVPRVPANPCTAGPCLTLYVSQAVWSLTSKLRPPGASLSSQYRPVRGTENPENLSPLGYGPSQSGHTGWRSGLRKGQQTLPPRQSITPNARGIFPTAKPAARAPGFATILLFAPWQLP